LKRKDEECKRLQLENDNKWKAKETVYEQKCQEYDQKINLIVSALEDYDIKLKWTNGGLLLTDLLYDEKDGDEDDDDWSYEE